MKFETDFRHQSPAVTGVAHFSCAAARLFAVLSDPPSWQTETTPRITASTASTKVVFSFEGEIRATAQISSWSNELSSIELVIEGFKDKESKESQEQYWSQVIVLLTKRLNGPEVKVASSPGKVNIYFAVGSILKDGFHEVASCYQALSLRERVAVELSGNFEIAFAGPFAQLSQTQVPKDQSNLVYKAGKELVANGAKLNPDLITFWINKSVPIAGGMAGGSADAAAALVALNELAAAGLEIQLQSIAANLGSDVPFALKGGTAIGIGRGEKLSAIAHQSILHWVMTPSSLGLSTPEVYRKLDLMRVASGVDVTKIEQPEVPQELIEALVSGDAATVAELMHNDLEIAALELRPELSETIELGRKAGALRSMVSGSGPTIAHLAKDRLHAEQIANRLGVSGVASIATYTSTSGTYLEN